ncbi:MAG: pyridoxal-phosphate dependent enzyme, partial [Pseudomonadota bacterium]
ALLSLCPAHAQTPLRAVDQLARDLGVTELWVKDERHRMGLGSFKALGAAYVIASAAAARAPEDWNTALAGKTYVTASAGNHGLSVAAGARLFGATAVIFISETVPAAFEERLAGYGARVVRAGTDYEASMVAAADTAQREGWTLLSDSSWPGYTEPAMRVMQGYLQMAAEAADQIPAAPTHIFLQAGVGGLAAAVAVYARKVWANAPQILVVEPSEAPALYESIRAGGLVQTTGGVSAMGRLDCKTASLVALKGLSRDADAFVLISEAEAEDGVAVLHRHGLDTTPSGGAGLAALIAGLDLPPDARVLTFLSEGPEDG